MYTKLFKVLRENPEGTITADLLKEMGLTAAEQRDCWYGDCFSSSYFFVNVKYDELIVDIVETIIALDISSHSEDIAEEAAGEDW